MIPDKNGNPGDFGFFLDFPTLGIDKYALYIGTAMFEAGGDEEFVHDTLYVVQKESLINGNPIITAFRNEGPKDFPVPEERIEDGDAYSTMQGVDNYDENSEFGYFIGEALHFGRLAVQKIIEPWSDHPSITSPLYITVPTTALNAPDGTTQKGNLYGFLIGTNADRLQMAHIIDNKLYTCQTIFVNEDGVGNFAPVGDRYAMRWYQLNIENDLDYIPELIQAGTLFDDTKNTLTPNNYYMGSIMTNSNEDLTIGCTISGLDFYINCAVAGRQKTDPLGVLKIGQTPSDSTYTHNNEFSFGLVQDNTKGGFPTTRWGDYSYTSLDLDKKTMWTIQEFVDAPNLYSCEVAKLVFPN